MFCNSGTVRRDYINVLRKVTEHAARRRSAKSKKHSSPQKAHEVLETQPSLEYLSQGRQGDQHEPSSSFEINPAERPLKTNNEGRLQRTKYRLEVSSDSQPSRESHNGGGSSSTYTSDSEPDDFDVILSAYEQGTFLGSGGQAHVYLYEKKENHISLGLSSKSPFLSLFSSLESPQPSTINFLTHGEDHKYNNLKSPPLSPCPSLPKFLAIKCIGHRGPDAQKRNARYHARATAISMYIRRRGGHSAILNVFYRLNPSHPWYDEHSFSAVMPACNGGDLHAFTGLYCRSTAWPPTDTVPEPFVWHVFKAIASALAFLHDPRCGGIVVHRDIKPANIMLHRPVQPSSDEPYTLPEVKLTDFDMAAFYDPDECSFRGGTRAYQPPEQARNPAPRATPAGDVFALGGVIYYLTTGGAPGCSETWNRITAAEQFADNGLRDPHKTLLDAIALEEKLDRKLAREDPDRLYELPWELSRIDAAHGGRYSTLLDGWMHAALTADHRVRPTAGVLADVMVGSAADVVLRGLSAEEKRLPREPDYVGFDAGRDEEWGRPCWGQEQAGKGEVRAGEGVRSLRGELDDVLGEDWCGKGWDNGVEDEDAEEHDAKHDASERCDAEERDAKGRHSGGDEAEEHDAEARDGKPGAWCLVDGQGGRARD